MASFPETSEHALANYDAAREEVLNLDLARWNTSEARMVEIALRNSRLHLAALEVAAFGVKDLKGAAEKYLAAQLAAGVWRPRIDMKRGSHAAARSGRYAKHMLGMRNSCPV